MAKQKKVTNTNPTKEAVAFLMSIPEIAEAFSWADIELAIDDAGWDRLAGVRDQMELNPAARTILVNKARFYWQKDPLAKQAVRLWTDYGIGDGMTFKAENDSVQAQLRSFCKHRRNRKVMSAAGQQRCSKKVLIDGEAFFAFFDDNGGEKIVRTIDPNQITDLITDPDDDECVVAFRRQTAKGKVLYYQAWDADEQVLADAIKGKKDQMTGKPIVIEADVVVYHLPFDEINKRGNSLLSTAIDWSREHRRFMTCRVAITEALSKFAFKATAKGGQAVLNQLKEKMQSSLVTSGTQGGPERNPKPAPGGTWLQNGGIDLQSMPRGTGAGDAKEDGNGLKLMVSAATGIMLHYFGDPSTGNLATATAMELPMLKMFASYQRLWLDAWRDMFSIVLGEDPDEEQAVIDIDLPPILQEDLAKMGAFISQVSTVFPEVKVPAVLQMLFIALGVNNLDEVMAAVKAKRVEIDAQQAEQDKLLANRPIMTPQQQLQQKESYDKLTEAFRELSGKL